MLYLDSSALAKLYVAEPGSEDVRVLVEAHRGRLFTSVVTWVEVQSALARCWRERRISHAQYQSQHQGFAADWRMLHAVNLSLPVLAPAERLFQQHALQAYDAIQLCSALWIGRPVFACFDARLRRAAAAEGLSVAPESMVGEPAAGMHGVGVSCL